MTLLLTLLAAAVDLEAQRSGAMGASALVATAAAVTSVVNEAPSFAAHTSGTIDMNSTLTVQSRSAYTLRLRVDSSSTVLLRTANGTYERLIPGESAFVSRSDGARESRLVDMVVRFAAIGERGALTAEVLTAPLDQ